MPDSSSTRGVRAIVIALIGVSIGITEVTGEYSHWPLVLLGIVVGLMAAKSIDR